MDNFPEIKDRVKVALGHYINGYSLKNALIKANITPTDFHRALVKHPDAKAAYESALEIKADFITDDVLNIADEAEDVNKARLQIQARQWLASKLNKRFSDKVDISVSQTIDISNVLNEARARLNHSIIDVGADILPQLESHPTKMRTTPTPNDIADIFD